jgi:hypothetical protein
MLIILTGIINIATGLIRLYEAIRDLRVDDPASRNDGPACPQSQPDNRKGLSPADENPSS